MYADKHTTYRSPAEPTVEEQLAGVAPMSQFGRALRDLGVELIPRIGVDNVMWASDYPHGDSTWPHSRKALAESSLAKHGPEILRKVTCENAARVYGFQY